MPEVAKSAINYDISSHTFEFISPEKSFLYAMPNSCTVACHDGVKGPLMNNTVANNTLTGWHSNYTSKHDEVKPIVATAAQAIANAPNYGFEQATIDSAKAKYNEANYSLNYVEADGTLGAHNNAFQIAILDFAKSRANEVITMLTPRTISGKIVDAQGNPVEGAQIMTDTKVWATTDAQGNFSFDYATSAKTFDVSKDEKKIGSFDVAAGTTDVNVGEIKTAIGAVVDYTLLIIAIIIIIIIIAAVVGLLLRKRKAPPTVEEKPVEEQK